jgi:pimeloyl-ACP methyl ester carboxylesterase
VRRVEEETLSWWSGIVRALMPLGLLVVLAGLSGCGGVAAKKWGLAAHARDRAQNVAAVLPPGPPTSDVLDETGLHDLERSDAADAARWLAQHNALQPDRDRTLALADLNLRAGRRLEVFDRPCAAAHYRDAAAYAVLAISDPELGNPSDSQVEQALRWHNEAVEELLRIPWWEGLDENWEWPARMSRLGIRVEASHPFLDPALVKDLAVARDYKVVGMQRKYAEDGWGVPLVVHRAQPPGARLPVSEHYHPEDLWVAATASLHVEGSVRNESWRRSGAALRLWYPYDVQRIAVGRYALRLAEDRTTPLAVHDSRVNFEELATLGMLKPDSASARSGLVLLQPYQPGKIPVLMIHGLNASHSTWFQTLNHLRNDPKLASRYQFWLYHYPTGNPIPVSAAGLRRELRQMRQDLDPSHQDAAWDQMVVVGHSMGGLLTKALIQSSGPRAVEAVFTVPLDQIRCRPETRSLVEEILVFEPVREVKRAVFIATPHKGSRAANHLTGRIVASLIEPPSTIENALQEIQDLNGSEVIAPAVRHGKATGLGNLKFESPTLRLLEELPISSAVRFHSIIFEIGTISMRLPTDGVVARRSASLRGATSEVVVPGHHNSVAEPEVTQELKRILRAHLRGLDGRIESDVVVE